MWNPNWSPLDPDPDCIHAVLLALVVAMAVAAMLLLLTGCATPRPRLILPPVPEIANLHIDGDDVTADMGGDQLLRGYVRCREINRDE